MANVCTRLIPSEEKKSLLCTFNTRDSRMSLKAAEIAVFCCDDLELNYPWKKETNTNHIVRNLKFPVVHTETATSGKYRKNGRE